MKGNQRQARIFALGAIASVLCAATFAPNASASPAWRVNGALLEEPESTLGRAGESSLTIPSLTNTCKPFVYGMTISNSLGTGQGSLTKMPLSNCFTNNKSCTIAKIGPGKLPWAAHLTTVSASNYLVIEGFRLEIVYAGEECVLGETLVVITGTAGGLYDNATESVTFSATSFKATGTALKALGQPSSWTGTFTMLTTGLHIGESLTVS